VPYQPGSTDAPGWLDGLAREHWDDLAPLLRRLGVLSDADRTGLALMCDEYRAWRVDPDNHRAKDRYIRLAIEYGLTPTSRVRIKAAPERPADHLQEFLEKKAR
jgi:phage terminase small subunit